MMGDSYHEYKFLVFLSPELYSAVTRLMAEKGLGRAYGCLVALTEGLHKMGYLSKEDYETYQKRYSQPLVPVKPLTKEQLEERVKLEELEAQFSGVLKTGLEKLSEKSRNFWLKKAREYQEKIPGARRILEQANSGNGDSQ